MSVMAFAFSSTRRTAAMSVMAFAFSSTRRTAAIRASAASIAVAATAAAASAASPLPLWGLLLTPAAMCVMAFAFSSTRCTAAIGASAASIAVAATAAAASTARDAATVGIHLTTTSFPFSTPAMAVGTVSACGAVGPVILGAATTFSVHSSPATVLCFAAHSLISTCLVMAAALVSHVVYVLLPPSGLPTVTAVVLLPTATAAVVLFAMGAIAAASIARADAVVFLMPTALCNAAVLLADGVLLSPTLAAVSTIDSTVVALGILPKTTTFLFASCMVNTIGPALPVTSVFFSGALGLLFIAK